MLKLKILAKHIFILMLFDIAYVGITSPMAIESMLLKVTVLSSILLVFIPPYLFRKTLLLIFLEKIMVVYLSGSMSLNVSYLVTLILWSGIVGLYLYLFSTELKEAYFNPAFSRYDLTPVSSSVSGKLDNNSSFYVTSISEKGFFASVNNSVRTLKGPVAGVINLFDECHDFKGEIVYSTKSGCGVKVVLNKNWYKLYTRVEKSRCLDFS